VRARVAIIGAGVGGLVAAAALRSRGFEIAVFEQAPRLRQQGSGLGLWTNAASALHELGIANILDGIAEPVQRLVFLSAQGERLNEIRLDRIARRFSAPSVNVHRSELLSAVAGEVREEAITFGARCVGFEQDARGVTVRFDDGDEHRTDLLVSADGAGSAIRRAIHGEDEKETRCWSGWQGVASPGPVELPELAGLFVLNGHALAGLYQLTQGRVHWFLDDPASRLTSERAPAPEVLLERVKGWPPVVRDAVASTPPGSIWYNEVRDLLPYRPWGGGRVTLLGDAAHPMLPTLGQGACQATGDAAALVRHLGSDTDVEAALRAYERRRERRVGPFVYGSRRSATARSIVPARTRDVLLRAAPPRLLSFLFGRIICPK
jgi:2-polyprenyl-6-methoxyphenol hydroxylase-like FAD-dependent oxidoreductase